MDMGLMGAWMALWMVVGVVVVVLAVVGAVALLQRRESTSRAEPPRDAAAELLRRRYAAGEIDEDEYLRRRAGLD